MAFTAICPAINEQLVNLAKEQSPQLKASQVGTLRATMEQYNMFNVEIVPLERDRSGKIASVQVMRQKRSTINQIVDGVPGDCVEAPFDVADNFATTYKINDGFSQPMKYFENDIRELCEGRNSWITKDIASRLDANRRFLNSKIITAMIANAGDYAGGVNSGTSPLALDLIQPFMTGAIDVGNYIGESTMLNALSDARVSSRPMAVGNGDLRNYVNLTKIGCCNNGGIDMSMAGNFFYFEDDQLTTALGNNNFYVLEAGALQFIPVLQYVGEYETMTETETRSTIIDPLIPGLSYDFKLYKPMGCDYWEGQLSSRFTVQAIYNDGYRSGDPLEGVNGIFQFNAAT